MLNSKEYIEMCKEAGVCQKRILKRNCNRCATLTCHYCYEFNEEKTYPPESAEKREALVELVVALKHPYSNLIPFNINPVFVDEVGNDNKCGYQLEVVLKSSIWIYAPTRPQALYKLITQLMQEGILEREEVRPILESWYRDEN